MTTGRTIALTRWTFVGKGMSLLFNMLSRLVITFLPRSKHLLISWLQSPSAVILEPRKTKSATVSLSICHEVMGPDAMILVFWMPTYSFHLFLDWVCVCVCVLFLVFGFAVVVIKLYEMYILEIKSVMAAYFASIFSQSIGCLLFCLWYPSLCKSL